MSPPVRLAITLLLALGALGLLGSVAALAADPGYTSCPSLSQFQSDINAIGVNGTGTITFDIVGCSYLASGPITTPDGSAVTINGNGLTVSGGTASAHGSFYLVDIGNDGSLTLDHSTLQYGTGIYAGAGALKVSNSTISNNSFVGIYSVSRTVTVIDSTISNNDGWGIYNPGGTVTVSNSSISGNNSYGIYAINGAVTVTNCTVSGNGSWGIFASSGNATVTNSTISNNGATGISGNGGIVTVMNSTINGNGFNGIFDASGTVTVTNSTISGNGDIGIGASFSTATVTNSTISDNRAFGIYAVYAGSGGTQATASLFVGNPTNCYFGNLTDDSYSLSTDSSCGFSGTGSQNSVSPSTLNLGTLGNYGGPTQTIPLLPGSIAINAIPLTPSGACLVGANTDQRGIARPQGSGCDIGAYELVTYTINPLFDEAKASHAGSTLPVKLQILDDGINLSAPDITVTAIDIDGDSSLVHTAGGANPSNVFRYDSSLDGYVLNLKTTGLSSGTHTLHFEVSGDPLGHSVTFTIK